MVPDDPNEPTTSPCSESGEIRSVGRINEPLALDGGTQMAASLSRDRFGLEVLQ